MLALPFLFVNAFIYICICIGQFRDGWQGARPDSFLLTLDVAMGTALLLISVRFLIRIARENYSLHMREE